jgi:hypothetical protein
MLRRVALAGGDVTGCYTRALLKISGIGAWAMNMPTRIPARRDGRGTPHPAKNMPT